MSKNIAICVTGWHFGYEFYSQICQLQDTDVFIVSHKKRSSIPRFIFELFPENHILIRKNIGYDWGCYQQFLETGIWKNYQYVFFMHDDVKILDLGFVDESIHLLTSGCTFVGNGRNSDKQDWPKTHLACYAHSSWKPPSLSFQHDTMRGSFFVTTSNTLQKLGKFEVFWDRFGLTIRFGNWSLISSGGKMQALFGDKAFGFLSNNYLTSSFIEEYERGGNSGFHEQGLKEEFVQTLLPMIIVNAEKYVRLQINSDAPYSLHWLFMLWYFTFIKVISSR